MMELDAEASDILSAHVAPCVHQLKQFFGLVTAKELRLQRFGYPIHFVSARLRGNLCGHWRVEQILHAAILLRTAAQRSSPFAKCSPFLVSDV
jgi:hypothetical protein